ncbi:MAG TPA: hypothetical protein VH157_00170, partial [Bryobacteraceae bacterium]|nr:hypothetical protein [Bryobacteraceae bacterium]
LVGRHVRFHLGPEWLNFRAELGKLRGFNLNRMFGHCADCEAKTFNRGAFALVQLVQFVH